MNILLLGSGGREHALAWKLAQSKFCTQLYIAPGNPGTEELGNNIDISIGDFEQVKNAVIQHEISMVVCGPEQPLVDGYGDRFLSDPLLQAVKFIGPTRAGAMLEGSKAFSKSFMNRHKIPTASYREFTAHNQAEAHQYLKDHALPIVLKADGLAAGKGVVICNSNDAAIAEFDEMIQGKFGAAGSKVVVEEFLDGIEFSLFVLTDGDHYKILPEAKDYKRIGLHNTGLNTGGMGAVSPVSFVTDELMQEVERDIVIPTIEGIKADKIIYHGFIYIGLMVCNGKPYVIEYNCRMGDPETQVVMPRLRNDLVELFMLLGTGSLAQAEIISERYYATTIVLASQGYPEQYEKNKEIFIDKEGFGGLLFHAGTIKNGKQLLSNGGRVMNVTATGISLKEAIKNANQAVEHIHFDNKYYRSDIGEDLL